MDDDLPQLGTCCACGGDDAVRNVMMLDFKAPEPDKGWGCVVCGLSADGAVVVLCDRCVAENMPLREVCAGYLGEGRRASYEEASKAPAHAHDESKHEEAR